MAQAVASNDPDPKALACYGLLVPGVNDCTEHIRLPFVAERPLRAASPAPLDWFLRDLAASHHPALPPPSSHPPRHPNTT